MSNIPIAQMEPVLLKSNFLRNNYTSKGLNIADWAESQSIIIVHSCTITIIFDTYITVFNNFPFQIVSFSPSLFDPSNLP